MSLLAYTANFYENDEPIRHLRSSCEKLGYQFASYGAGRGFPGYINAKVKEHAEFLETRSEDLVCYCDSDTLFLRPPSDLLWRYREQGSPSLLISSERSLYPHWVKRLQSYPEAPTPWRYINSGHILGSREYLLDRLQWMLSTYGETPDLQDSDQSYWHMAFLDGRIDCKIDHWCLAFQTMSDHNGDLEQQPDGLFYNRLTGAAPCAVHFNGRLPGIEHAYTRRFTD